MSNKLPNELQQLHRLSEQMRAYPDQQQFVLLNQLFGQDVEYQKGVHNVKLVASGTTLPDSQPQQFLQVGHHLPYHLRVYQALYHELVQLG